LKGNRRVAEYDEYAHEANERPDWRESYYFNWVDIDSGISGFSTIGLLPNTKKREFVFALFYDQEREIHYNEPIGPFSDDLSESLTDGILSYNLLTPLKKWHINYRGKNLRAEISWPARFSAYGFGSGSGTSWDGHFEQSGKPHGTVEFSDGRTVQIKGLGERDKSWGARDWHIESWFALHAQFDNISIGLRRDMVKGMAHSSGGISNSEGYVPVKSVELATETHSSGMPIGAKVRILGIDNTVYNLRSHLITSKSIVRFAREFPGGSTELYEGMAIHDCEELNCRGTGLLEWLQTHQTK
jgi:hypothetical protein